MHIFNKHDMTQHDFRAEQSFASATDASATPADISPLDKLDAMLTAGDAPEASAAPAQAAPAIDIADNGFAKLGLDAAILRALSFATRPAIRPWRTRYLPSSAPRLCPPDVP